MVASTSRADPTPGEGASQTGRPLVPGPDRSPRTCTGYTLVELTLVLVILGVLAAVSAPRFFGTNAFESRGFYEEMVAAARHARHLAVSTQCPVQVDIDATADSYALYWPDDDDGNAATCDGVAAGFGANSVRHPVRGENFAGSAPNGVDVTGSDLTYYYDGLGRPSAPGTVTVGARSLTVEPETGYVH